MKILNYIEDLYYDTRDHILNSVARWCIQHCGLYSSTVYAVAKKTYAGSWEVCKQACVGYQKEEA